MIMCTFKHTIGKAVILSKKLSFSCILQNNKFQKKKNLKNNKFHFDDKNDTELTHGNACFRVGF